MNQYGVIPMKNHLREFGYLVKTYGLWSAISRNGITWGIRNWFFPQNRIKITTLDSSFHDTDEMLLHGMFKLLTNFVELQWDGGKSPYFGQIFSIEEINQGGEWEKESLVSQNVSTKEIWDLYNWWTKIRPARVDPYSLIYEYNGEKPKFVKCEGGSKLECLTEENQEKYRAVAKESCDLEERHEQEDEDMLIRLVKVRRHLWT